MPSQQRVTISLIEDDTVILQRLIDSVRALEDALRSQLAATGQRDAPLGAIRATLLRSYVAEFLRLDDRRHWPVEQIGRVRLVHANFPAEPALWDTLFFLALFNEALTKSSSYPDRTAVMPQPAYPLPGGRRLPFESIAEAGRAAIAPAPAESRDSPAPEKTSSESPAKP